MSQRRTETLELLHSAYDALTKAGEDSLSKAYTFGNVVNALHGIFTYAQLAEEIGVTTSTVSKYAKLYRKFPTEKALLDMARALKVYDVGILGGDAAHAHYAYKWHCQNCGSYDVKKERQEPEAAQVPETASL